MKKKVLVRLEDSMIYKTHIEIDFSKVKNIMLFPDDVFFKIDGLKVAVKREDCDNIQNEILEKNK